MRVVCRDGGLSLSDARAPEAARRPPHGGTVEGTDFGAAVSIRILLPQENAGGL